MPKLIAVRYRLLQGEEPAALAAASDQTHDFGGELVLTLDGGSEIFVSWVNEPVQYSVGTKDSSHFKPGADLRDHDVSSSKMWAGLVGNEVTLNFIAPDHQILEVASAQNRLLLCSFERGSWWADEITICRQAPALYDA